MTKSVFLVCMVFLFSIPFNLFAQTKTITGKVVNQNDDPVPLATVQEKGTDNSVISNEQGVFKITTTGKNPVLLISSVNYEAQQITVDGKSSFEIVMKPNTQLSEVVVTALGITRQKKSLGYSAQIVNSKEFIQNHQIIC